MENGALIALKLLEFVQKSPNMTILRIKQCQNKHVQTYDWLFEIMHSSFLLHWTALINCLIRIPDSNLRIFH